MELEQPLRLLLQQTLHNALSCLCPADWGYLSAPNYRFLRGGGTWEKEGLADDGQISSAPCHPSQPPRGASTGCAGVRHGPDAPVGHPNTFTSQNHHQVIPTWVFVSHILCSLPVYYVFQLPVEFFFFFKLKASFKLITREC